MNDETQPDGNGAAPELPDEMEMPDLPETVITPFGMRVEKIGTHNGTIVLQKILTPGHVYTIKYAEEQASELASAFSSGIKVATAADLAQLRSRG